MTRYPIVDKGVHAGQRALPLAPLGAWLRERLEREPLESLAARLDVDPSQCSRWARCGWLPAQVEWRVAGPGHGNNGNRPMVIAMGRAEAALGHADVRLDEIWPALGDVELEPDAFCFACRTFVTPFDGCCAWCDRPIERVDLRNLPPRLLEAQAREPAEVPPELVVRHRPRVHSARPFYFDVLLDRRRSALEAFARTRNWLESSRVVWEGAWASPESCAQALRSLAIREGWLRRGGRTDRAQRARAAQAAVVKALADGTWDRVADPHVARSRRRILDERLLREAAWIYLYDELSMRQVARRLHARALEPCTLASFTTALQDEWDRHGWPRRSTHAAMARRHHAPPTGQRRCEGLRQDGRRCTRWATAGKAVCFDHDPDAVERRRARNQAASDARNVDAVPIAPLRWWLRRQVKAQGSVRAVHARLGATVHYDTLAGWVALREGARSARATRIRRSTIDRVLTAWGDGTTFEQIYLPVGGEDEEPLVA